MSVVEIGQWVIGQLPNITNDSVSAIASFDTLASDELT